jgi:hypothetical protein
MDFTTSLSPMCRLAITPFTTRVSTITNFPSIVFGIDLAARSDLRRGADISMAGGGRE